MGTRSFLGRAKRSVPGGLQISRWNLQKWWDDKNRTPERRAELILDWTPWNPCRSVRLWKKLLRFWRPTPNPITKLENKKGDRTFANFSDSLKSFFHWHDNPAHQFCDRGLGGPVTKTSKVFSTGEGVKVPCYVPAQAATSIPFSFAMLRTGHRSEISHAALQIHGNFSCSACCGGKTLLQFFPAPQALAAQPPRRSVCWNRCYRNSGGAPNFP
jgi:hypothetical protein